MRVNLPARDVLLPIDGIAGLVAGQLAAPEENRFVHRRMALLAALPSLAARVAAAEGLEHSQRQRSLEALAKEVDELPDVEAGVDVSAEVERRLRSDNVVAWSYRVLDGLKSGTLQARLSDGMKLAWPESAARRAPGWVSAGDLAEWLAREGYRVTHEEGEAAACADGTQDAVERAESEPATTVHRTNRRRQGDAFAVLIDSAKQEALDPTAPASLWAAMVEIARRPNAPAPLLGADEDGIKFLDDRTEGGIRHYTKEHLRDRLRKRRR